LRTGLAPRLEDIAPFAITKIELIADDREEHRVGAIEQLAVHDGVDAKVHGQVDGATAVPTETMAVFRFHEALAAIIMVMEAGQHERLWWSPRFTG
jgi:hypothetical protein